MHRIVFFFARRAPVFAIFGGACVFDPEDSCRTETAEISMSATVLDNGDTVRAAIDFAVGDRGGMPAWLRLCDDDTLTINGRRPHHFEKSRRHEYAIVTDEREAVRDFTIRLDRKSHDTVIEATAHLPEPFTIHAPSSGESRSRSQDMTLEWAPVARGTVQVQLVEELGGGPCLQTPVSEHDYKRQGGVSVPDRGSWRIPAAAIVTGTAATTCKAQVWLTRVRDSPYPAPLAPGGIIEGRVLRVLPLTSTP